MDRAKKKFTTIDEYMRSFPADVQEKLKEIRRVIIEQAPLAEEKISYQMPAFFQNGVLVYFAAFSRHIGFYPTASGIAAFKSALSKYRSSKGAVQFPLNEPVPLDLIRKIVQFRVDHNSGKVKEDRRSMTGGRRSSATA